jgi:hypothetical protein
MSERNPIAVAVAELRDAVTILEHADPAVGTPAFRLLEAARAMLARWDEEVGKR